MEPSTQHAAQTPIRRLQILAIAVIGALTVLAFALSLVLDGEAGRIVTDVTGALGFLCAVIGVSFALVGNRR